MNIPSVIKRGYDTWVNQFKPHLTHGTTDWFRVSNESLNVKRGLLWMPVPARSHGRTIASATLTGHAHGTISAGQTFTVAPISSKWHAKKATWNNQPGTTGTSITLAVGTAISDGGQVVFDVTSLVQQIANGLDNFGWKITTDVTTAQVFASFNSGKKSWSLEINYVDGPDAPTSLSPNGTVVSTPLPISTFDYTTFGGDDSDLAKVSFQIDVGNNGSTDYDSGWVATTVAQANLATSGLSVTAGTTVAYRYKVQDAGGQESQYSDWATYTYQPLPTLTIDSPAAGVLFDPTSDILAHISTTHLEAYRIRVTEGDDRTAVLFDTGKTQADDPSDIAYTLPLKNDDGSRIFTDDAQFQINVRAYDDYEREATPGASAHAGVWTTVTFDDDGALNKVSSFRVTQFNATPFVKLTWTDPAAADAYLISRDGAHVARLEAADVIAGVSAYTWLDVSATPGDKHVYEIRRITEGVGRSPARRAPIQFTPEGIWLLRDNGDWVVLDGDGIDQLQILERRLTFKPLHKPYSIDILTAYEGISGPIVASIEENSDQSIHNAKQVLKAIKNNPTETVRLIFANVSIPVEVSQVEVLPDPTYREDQRRHAVRFNVQQVGEFDYKVGG